MKFCTRCGTPRAGQSKFCPACGAPFPVAPPDVPASGAEVPPPSGHAPGADVAGGPLPNTEAQVNATAEAGQAVADGPDTNQRPQPPPTAGTDHASDLARPSAGPGPVQPWWEETAQDDADALAAQSTIWRSAGGPPTPTVAGPPVALPPSSGREAPAARRPALIVAGAVVLTAASVAGIAWAIAGPNSQEAQPPFSTVTSEDPSPGPPGGSPGPPPPEPPVETTSVPSSDASGGASAEDDSQMFGVQAALAMSPDDARTELASLADRGKIVYDGLTERTWTIQLSSKCPGALSDDLQNSAGTYGQWDGMDEAYSPMGYPKILAFHRALVDRFGDEQLILVRRAEVTRTGTTQACQGSESYLTLMTSRIFSSEERALEWCDASGIPAGEHCIARMISQQGDSVAVARCIDRYRDTGEDLEACRRAQARAAVETS